MATVSFSKDIMPVFKQYKSQMIWRFDITNYDVVKANALLIWNHIDGNASLMPPPPFPAFNTSFVQSFRKWMDEDFPP